MKNLFFLFITAVFSLITKLSFAEEKDPALFSFGSGIFNICKNTKRGLLQMEYIPSSGIYSTYPVVIRPLTGFMMTTDLTTYLFGGIRVDLFATKRFAITPSFAPGLYFRAHGKNLRFPLEFRSAIEMSLIQKNKARITLQFYHISNASLGKKNPGAEALVLLYSIPL